MLFNNIHIKFCNQIVLGINLYSIITQLRYFLIYYLGGVGGMKKQKICSLILIIICIFIVFSRLCLAEDCGGCNKKNTVSSEEYAEKISEYPERTLNVKAGETSAEAMVITNLEHNRWITITPYRISYTDLVHTMYIFIG